MPRLDPYELVAGLAVVLLMTMWISVGIPITFGLLRVDADSPALIRFFTREMSPPDFAKSVSSGVAGIAVVLVLNVPVLGCALGIGGYGIQGTVIAVAYLAVVVAWFRWLWREAAYSRS